jgi:excisionase family DNA binding protein
VTDRTSAVSRSLVTAQEVAELLGVPASWVYEQSRRGRIPTVTLGRYRRYRMEAIEQWVQTLEAQDLPVANRGPSRSRH